MQLRYILFSLQHLLDGALYVLQILSEAVTN
jgi:hypothetical protein